MEQDKLRQRVGWIMYEEIGVPVDTLMEWAADGGVQPRVDDNGKLEFAMDVGGGHEAVWRQK